MASRVRTGLEGNFFKSFTIKDKRYSISSLKAKVAQHWEDFAFQKWNSKKLKNELKYTKKGSKKRWIVENIGYFNALGLQVLQLKQVKEVYSILGN